MRQYQMDKLTEKELFQLYILPTYMVRSQNAMLYKKKCIIIWY